MSLKAFHIAFVVISLTLAIGFGYWCMKGFFAGGEVVLLVAGIASLAAAIGLGMYGRYFLRKLKGIPFL